MKLTRNEQIEAAVAQVDAAIRRQQARSYSRQPRFGETSPADFFASVIRWVQNAGETEPEYVADNRTRDGWLRDFWRKEPHLAGVINSVVSIDQNRAWTLTGGRNQVNRFTRILRDAEDGQGWRRYIQLQALSYYTADIGAVTETGRDGVDGPLRALYHVDPARCRLTGERERPLHYDNTDESWTPMDFFRVTSLVSTDEEFYGLGWCAVSRCLELAKIMLGVYAHDHEMLGSRAPRGLLVLQNISQDTWNEAMKQREAMLDAKGWDYYGAVAVLAGGQGLDNVDAKLIALSQLPANFDMKVFTDLLMYGYALCFGYDPIEFWPVSAGALGRGKETEIQHRKATGKGGANFMLSYQDQIQLQMPNALLFEFEQRDQEGLLLDASVAMAWAEVANALYAEGLGVLTKEQAASLLAQQGIIPAEWTQLTEQTMVDDSDNPDGAPEEETPAGLAAPSPDPDEQLRRRLLETEHIQRAIVLYPDEPIVQFTSHAPGYPHGRMKILWRRGGDAVAWRTWHVVPRRQLSGPIQREGAVLYEGEDFTITDEDVDQAIAEARERVGDEFAELLEAEPVDDADD